MNDMLYIEHLTQEEPLASEKRVHRAMKRGARMLKSLKDNALIID